MPLPPPCLQMYLVVEALADGGVRMGLPRQLAQRLAAQTMMVGLSQTLTQNGTASPTT